MLGPQKDTEKSDRHEAQARRCFMSEPLIDQDGIRLDFHRKGKGGRFSRSRPEFANKAAGVVFAV